MTRQEVKLWVRLRELQALGFHFRRQSPIGRYIVDFECRRRRPIVEVDGTQVLVKFRRLEGRSP
jgi:very-short-patch-repair endonuclease